MCVQCEYHERGSQALSVRSACVSSVLYTCVHACEALCSERVDAAHPGALAVQTSFVFARWSGGVLFCTAKVKSKVTRQLKALLRRVSRRGGRRTLCSLARCSTAHATVCAHAAARGQCARRKPSISLALSGTELQLRTSKTTCQPTSKKTMSVQPTIRCDKS